MKRAGIVIGAVLVVAAIVGWRYCGRPDNESSSTKPSSAKPVGAKKARATEPQVRPDPTKLVRASIEGVVTSDAKAPVAGARVCASGYSHDLDPELLRDLACATADAQGHYKLENVLPAKYTVSAGGKPFRPGVHHPGGDRKKTLVIVAAGQQVTGVDIVLRAGGVELTGVVSDLTGGPIEKARIIVREGRWGGSSNMFVETAADGTFSVWTSQGNVNVVASAEGYADEREWGYAPGKLEILLTPESVVTGIVVDAVSGDPIEGARVSVGGSEWSDGSTFSDAKGQFRVARLTPGRYVATARTDRGYGRTEGSTLVGLGQTVDGIVVKLHKAIRIEGKVIISTTKAPCEQLHVGLNDGPKGRWLSVRTERDGTFWAEGVLAGKYSVDVGCEGYQSKEKYEPVVVTDKDISGLVFEVEPGATITGRVLAKNGTPIESANVSASTTGGDARKKGAWGDDDSARDGTYKLDGLRAGTYKIEVHSDKAVPPKDPPKIEVAAGATVQKDLVMEDVGTIKGTVVDSTGKPVAGISLRAQPLSGVQWWGSGDHKTDETGAFTIDSVRPGDYKVMAQITWSNPLRKPGTNDDAEQGERVTVRANQTASVKLVVEAQTGVIKGVVNDSAGFPVSDAFISSVRESDAAGAQKTSVNQTRWSWDEKPVLTGTDGTFTLTKLAPGKYTVRAYRKGGGEAIAEHVAIGETAKLQIKPTGSIAGTVSGAPEEITITVRDLVTAFWRRESFFRTEGRFSIPDLPKGKFQISASSESGQAQIDIELNEGEVKKDVTIQLDALVTLTGRVVEHGTTKPVSGMRMSARPVMGGGGMGFSSSGDERDFISDEQGKFTIKNVPRGKLMVRGNPRDWNDGDYGTVSAIRTVEGTGTIDLGDITAFRKRVKQNEPGGKLGLKFKENPPDTPPDKRIVEISYIDPAGPAAKTELKVGDVITSIDGIDITGAGAVNSGILMYAPPGAKLAFGLARGATITVVLAAP